VSGDETNCQSFPCFAFTPLHGVVRACHDCCSASEYFDLHEHLLLRPAGGALLSFAGKFAHHNPVGELLPMSDLSGTWNQVAIGVEFRAKDFRLSEFCSFWLRFGKLELPLARGTSGDSPSTSHFLNSRRIRGSGKNN
jgi:hypothetical protein